MSGEPVLRLDRSPVWDRAVAAALDYLLTRRGERVRASEIWGAIHRRGPFRIVVATAEGKEIDRTDDRATQIAEVRFLMNGLYRRAKVVDASDTAGDPVDTEYVVLR